MTRSRAAALALALVLVAVSAPAMPADCCVASEKAPPTVRAVDCCETMLECPAPRAISAIVNGPDPAQGLRLLVADSVEAADGAAGIYLPAAPDVPHASRPPRPPLYRLHAQLLI